MTKQERELIYSLIIRLCDLDDELTPIQRLDVLNELCHENCKMALYDIINGSHSRHSLQIRRGTAAEHATFTGSVGEITMDTTNNTIRVHDGATVGGVPLAKQSEIQTIPNFVPDYDNETKITNGTIYYADKTYLAIIARGSGANAVLEISRNADMSNKKLLANIYITSPGNIMFAIPAIIPAGYYYRTTNVGETRLYPII